MRPNPAHLITPALVVYGSGSAERIGQYVQQTGASRPLLISDRGLQAAGVVDSLCSWLQTAGFSAELYLDVQPEPSIDSLSPALEMAQATDCDCVIGLGGGSALDIAKTVAMLLKNEGSAEQYLGSGLVPHRGLPSLLLPTTAGTGAEITPNALFYIPERSKKEAIVSPHLIPDVALIDPVLTLSVPPHVTAATGVDALCHAIESYTSKNATPLSRPYAKEAIRVIAQHLRRAVIDGGHLPAREGMALGSLYAAISLANSSTNAVHALAYPLQGLFRVTHGVANSLLLPYVLEFNLLGDVDLFAEVAELLGQSTVHLSRRDAATASTQACRQLSLDVGIPQTLQEVGVFPDALDDLVAGALQIERLLKNNPRAIGEGDIRSIFKRAFLLDS